MTGVRKVAAAALAAAIVLVGCGGEEETQPQAQPQEQTHNAADVAFAQGMIPHHEQAIEMSRMAGRASSEEVKALARRIEAAQAPEIEQMKGWLSTWGEPVKPEGGGHAGHGGHGGPGMMTEAEMAELERASGKRFDRLFLEMMIRHHQGAITMSQEELQSGKSQEAKDLAASIKSAQQREIREMRGLLRRL